MTKLRLILMDGPKAGEGLDLEPGSFVSFGRSEPAKIALTWDTFLSREHFSIGNESSGWKVIDAGSRNGTFLNGSPVTEAVLMEGDIVQAGGTKLRVEFTHPPTPPERLMQVIRKEPLPLFAVLDAAIGPEVGDLLRKTTEPFQSLYEGPEAQDLSDVAPYLVQLTGRDTLFESLIYGGWGNAWGIYLNSQASFKDVRRQLRRFLRVTNEQKEKLYFRYYDPRVLRTWLTTCTSAEAVQFFGPFQFVYAEHKDPLIVLKCKPGAEGVDIEELTYNEEEEAASQDEQAAERRA